MIKGLTNTVEAKKFLQNIWKQLDQKVINAVWIWQEIFISKAKEISPTDTTKYIKNHKKSWIKKRDWIIEWSVYNNTEYSVDIEFWKWRDFNYHQWPKDEEWLFGRTIIYTWTWNRTYTRAKAHTEPIYNDYINQATKL